ncbi:MAG: NUDIX domain-containing protein [Chitinophagaceae bacterium]|nr:NUDIX domain-containing protein [Chitinophagaceae bacterium]
MEKILAAGGIVENEEKEILMIFRRGKWDLPKGKLDEGETIEECAVREVEEETGLRSIQQGELIDVTLHTYFEKGNEIEKETYWYAMKVEGDQKLVAQSEEDIEDIRWVKETELPTYLNNSYPNIVDIIEKYYDKSNQVN